MSVTNNIIPQAAFRSMKSSVFQERCRTNTVVAQIAKMHKDKKNCTIYSPYRGNSVIISGSMDPMNPCDTTTPGNKICSIPVQVAEHAYETCQLTEWFASAEAFCEDTVGYTDLPLLAQSIKEQTIALEEELDRRVLADIAAQVGLSADIPAPTTPEEVCTLIACLLAKFAGCAGAQGNYFIVMGNSKMKIFAQHFMNRETIFGDSVLQTGSWGKVGGMDVYVIKDNQMPAGVCLIAGLKGAVDVYLDEFGLRYGERPVTPAGNQILEDQPTVCFADVSTTRMYYCAKVWLGMIDRLCVIPEAAGIKEVQSVEA